MFPRFAAIKQYQTRRGIRESPLQNWIMRPRTEKPPWGGALIGGMYDIEKIHYINNEKNA